MEWTFDGSEWRAKGSYAEFRVFENKQIGGFRGENVVTGVGARYPTVEEAKACCEAQDRRMRM